MPDTNGWDEYKQLVLFEMKENGKRFDKISSSIEELRVDVATLKTKAKIVGAITGGTAGLVGTGLMSAIAHLWK
jgi:hypothetical protein